MADQDEDENKGKEVDAAPADPNVRPAAAAQPSATVDVTTDNADGSKKVAEDAEKDRKKKEATQAKDPGADEAAIRNDVSIRESVHGNVHVTSTVDKSVKQFFGVTEAVPDPTSSFARFEPKRLREPEEVVRRWQGELLDKRLLLLSCAEVSILPHAVNKLIDHPDCAKFEAREWVEAKQRTDALRFEFFADRRATFGKGGPVLIAMRLAQGSPFLDSVLEAGLESVAAVLRENDVMLILKCAALPRTRKGDLARFPHWRLDFLRYTLDLSFKEPGEAAKLAETLQRQRSRGSWGSSINDAALKQRIEDILLSENGAERLRREVDAIDQQAEEASREAAAASVPRVASGGTTPPAVPPVAGKRPDDGEPLPDELPPRGAARPVEEKAVTQPEVRPLSPSVAPAASPVPVLAGADKLGKAILFTAAFFPRLSLQEFERALCTIAGEETMDVIEERQQTFPGATADEPPRVVTHKEPKPTKLLMLWRQDEDGHLQKCHLRSMSLPTGERVVEFTTPARAHLQQEFEYGQAFYTLHRRRRVLSSGWFFEEDLSEQVLQNLLALATSAATAAPATYGKELLMGATRGMVEYLSETDQQGQAELAKKIGIRLEHGLESAEDFAELLRVAFENREFWSEVATSRRRHIDLRLSQLCRRMLEEPALGKCVNEYFEELLVQEQYELVLGLGEKLRDAPDFDYWSWLRRILNTDVPARWAGAESKSLLQEKRAQRALEARADVQEWLDRELGQGNLPAYRLLEVVRGWLPAAGKEPAQFSMAECYALAFLQRFAEKTDRTGESWEKEKYDAAVSNPVLARWRLDGEAPGLDSDALATWLTHKGLPYAARIHWLDHLTGRIQKGRPYRTDLLLDLGKSLPPEGRPGLDNVEVWEEKLREMAKAADDEDFAAFQISDFLAHWTMTALPLLGEPPPASLACWEKLLEEVARGLRNRKKLVQQIDRTWGVWTEALLKRLGEPRLRLTKETKGERTRSKALRSLLLRLRRQFQFARNAVARTDF